MCTAITFNSKDFYFGRTLDYEFSYGEQITITPRDYSFSFSNNKVINHHYAIIGMAHIENNYPLYYDAINEKGLVIAGLNFVQNAKYSSTLEKNKDNIASYELIPYVLSSCSTIDEVKILLNKINIIDKPFNSLFPTAQLHWIIADKNQAITLEVMKDGMHIYDNNVGVLTNNPPFNIQMDYLNKYSSLSNKSITIEQDKTLDYSMHSRGLGAVGLPGDLSSMSRFARVCFVKSNSICNSDEISSVNQFFHILHSVEQQRGCCEVKEGDYEITIYTSCCNATKGIYYYSTYNNHQISMIDMNKENLDGDKLISYPMIYKENIYSQN